MAKNSVELKTKATEDALRRIKKITVLEHVNFGL